MKKTFNDYRREEDGSEAFGDFTFGKPKPVEGGTGGAGSAGDKPTPKPGDADYVAPVTPPTPEVVTGPTAVEIATDTAKFNDLSAKDVATLTDVEKKELADLKVKYEIKEVDEEGKEITADEKKKIEETNKRVKEITAKAEYDRTLAEIKFLADNTTREPNIYEEVDKITGEPIEITDSELKPGTVEWVAKREEIKAEKAIEAFEVKLSQEYPLAYQFLLHQQAGGSPESFFSQNNEDYRAIALTKEDKATQELVYRKALALKGNTQQQVDGLVKIAKDSSRLFEESSLELSILQKRQEAEAVNRKAQAEQAKQQEIAVTQTFFKTLETVIEKGVTGVVIPKAERQAFGDFVTSRVWIRNGQVIYYRPVDIKNLENELAPEYFAFKKGDLKSVVERKAASLNAEGKRKQVRLSLVPRTAGAPVAGQKVPMNQI